MCPEHATEPDETARARAYLIETATPGYTMTRQGPERAIGWLHPEFVKRLAAAIGEARGAGLPFAGIFSAYRPPVFGVGGFADKFHSLHTYGRRWQFSGVGNFSSLGESDMLLPNSNTGGLIMDESVGARIPETGNSTGNHHHKTLFHPGRTARFRDL